MDEAATEATADRHRSALDRDASRKSLLRKAVGHCPLWLVKPDRLLVWRGSDVSVKSGENQGKEEMKGIVDQATN